MVRMIDELPAPRQVRPTKIVVLSRSRVGTTSLYTALGILGYETFHSKQVFATDSSTNMRLFEEALRNKYLNGSGKRYGKEDFDKWFADYDAIMTVPQYFFDEFLDFYPDAKFIITDRDADSWIKSVKNTICELMKMTKSFPLSFLRRTDPWLGAFCALTSTLEQVIFFGKGSVAGIEEAKSDFIIRQKQIQVLSKRANVAVFRLEDGFSWEKLCPFLGHEVPQVPYPNAYNQDHFHTRWANVLRPKMWNATATLIGIILVPLLGIWALYFS
ncbi:tubulin [Cordyceps javanica]|uniref:Tubulin n=1 Tax=Cordyceps javanica TaxID=43265 RepID=A0A545WE31_9HYPO|nr:tubulin [Cordyceps javanica]TQW12240.1 tubulin [Cordyceps javanica]